MTTFATQGVSVRFGGVHALSDVSVVLQPGTITGLIGPNGAGKTTFIDAVSGFVRSSGSVMLGDRDVSKLAAFSRARLGIRRTWQAADLFDDLSVEENLSVAAHRGPLLGRGLRARRTDVNAQVDATLALLGLRDLATAHPGQLSQGQRKLVGVGRALVGRPHVALLDEPAAGLDTEESRHLGSHLQAVAATGPALLLVDHDMGLVLSVCDQVVVLDSGCVIASGTPAEVKRNPDVIAAYIGAGEPTQARASARLG